MEDRENYIRDGLAHLSDDHKIDSDPTTMLGEALNEQQYGLIQQEAGTQH